MSGKKVGIWVRVSTSMQVEKETHVHHEMRAKAFAKSRDWEVVKTYRLEGLSGKSVMDYDETKQMLYDIKTGVISGIIFSKIARLARNTKELIEIAEIFQQQKADLISMDMSIDTSTPMGRHFFRMMSSMAEWEREVIADRITASVKTRAQLGRQIGGQAPFGYVYIDKKLQINQEEAPIRKLMFELFVVHRRKRTVARILNEKGYRTRKGKLFSGTAVGRLLTDSVAKGIQVMNRQKVENGKIYYKPKEEWSFHKVDAIVSEELWDTVNTIIEKQNKERTQPLNKLVQLFTGFVYCNCGSQMRTRSNAKTYICVKRCGNKINKEDLEEIFRNELYNYSVSPEQIDNYISNVKDMVLDKEQQLQSLQKEKGRLETKIESLINLHVEGQIETGAFKSHHQKPYERIQQIEKSVSELEGEIVAYSNQEYSTQIMFDEAKNLYERWGSLTHVEKRNIIEIITNRITIGDEDIDIHLYNILPDNYLSFTARGRHTHLGR